MYHVYPKTKSLPLADTIGVDTLALCRCPYDIYYLFARYLTTLPADEMYQELNKDLIFLYTRV